MNQKTKEETMVRKREDELLHVRVCEKGGVFTDVEVPEGSTVKVALEKAGARLDVSKEIRVGSESVDLEDIVEEGDTITVIPQTKGNN